LDNKYVDITCSQKKIFSEEALNEKSFVSLCGCACFCPAVVSGRSKG
jgi:hypothetical protein